MIAIGPDYSNGWYADWVTMKVAPNGVRLWSRLFDALNGNNEIPGYVAVDPFDNVYVTGTGGPAVIAANGSQYLRMVTLKYTASGEPVWMIASVDGFRGNVARVGQDGSTLFVQGYGQMYTARYRQTGLSAAPAAPTNLTATGVFDGFSYAANLSWSDNATNEFWYDIYRCSGAGCTGYVKIARTGENDTSYVRTPPLRGFRGGRGRDLRLLRRRARIHGRLRRLQQRPGHHGDRCSAGARDRRGPRRTGQPRRGRALLEPDRAAVDQQPLYPDLQSRSSAAPGDAGATARSRASRAAPPHSPTAAWRRARATPTRVRAYSAAGWSSYSATVTAKTLR